MTRLKITEYQGFQLTQVKLLCMFYLARNEVNKLVFFLCLNMNCSICIYLCFSLAIHKHYTGCINVLRIFTCFVLNFIHVRVDIILTPVLNGLLQANGLGQL